jgi:hypothetical protein
MNFDAGTGKIYITAAASVRLDTNYTITATPGLGSGYIGTKSAVVKIRIKETNISMFSLRYNTPNVIHTN